MQETLIQVCKRDGRIEDYDRNKLSISLIAAARAVVSAEFRDGSAREDILTILGFSPETNEGENDPVREAYTRSTIGDELYEAIELVAELVENSLDEYDNPIHTGDLSVLVHKALVEAGQGALLREYVMRATSRERTIEGAGALMKAVRELTFVNSQHSNAKRDNANVDGDTAMGTMLQYGATASKTFALHGLIPEHIANAHSAGNIHIHDLEFYPLTLTCIPTDQLIVVKHEEKIKVWLASKLSSYTSGEPIDFEVWSGGCFVKVYKVMSKPAHIGSTVLLITTEGGGELRVTPEHFVSVYNEDNTVSDVVAMELKPGMKLVRDSCVEYTPIEYISLHKWFRHKTSLYLDDTDGRIAKAIKGDNSWARTVRGMLSKNRILHIINGEARLKTIEYNGGSSDLTLKDLRYTTRAGKRSLADTVILSEELACFIGYMLASGSFCSGGLIYNAPDKHIAADFKRCAEAVLWADCVTINNLCCKIIGEERMLQALFEGPFGYLKAKNGVSRYNQPSWLSQAPSDFIYSFAKSIATSRLLPRRITGMRDAAAILTVLGIDIGLNDSSVLLNDSAYSVIKAITPIEYNGPLYDIETENHHFAVNGFAVHNCCQIDLDKLFEGGFNTGHGHIRTPASIESYAALTCIAIQSNQNDQHGGQSIPALDYYLERGVAKTLAAEIAEFIRAEYEITECGTEEEHTALEASIKNDLFSYIVEKRVLHTDEGEAYVKEVVGKYAPECEAKFEKTWEIACRRTEKRTRQAMESLVHNLNSMHSRAGAQIPFSSINFGTDTTWEGRLISHKFLDAIEAGLGAGETPIFPISIFKLKKGINLYSTDPNYDLFKKSIHVTAKRMYPNFSNIDAPYNLQYYKEGNFATEAAYMGCLASFECVTYRYKGNIYTDSFERVWDKLLADGFHVNKCGLTAYMEPEDLWVYDSRNYGTTKVKTLIRNTHISDWLEIRLSTGQLIHCTPDHPWPTDTGRKKAEKLKIGDKLFLTLSGESLNMPAPSHADAYTLGCKFVGGELDLGDAAQHLYANINQRNAFAQGMLDNGVLTDASYRSINYGQRDRALVALNLFTSAGYNVDYDGDATLLIDTECNSEFPRLDCDMVGTDGFVSVAIAEVRACNIKDQFSYDFETESGWFDVSGLQSFNCRTRVIADVNGDDEVTGRGNLSFTTLNLPQIALTTKEISAFYSLLEARLNLVLEQLLSRLDIVAHRKVANMPFLMGQHLWKNSENLAFTDEVGDVLKHGTLSIGFVGLAESLTVLTGYHHGENEESQKLGLEIIGFMRKFCDDKSKELSLNVTLLATPAESACGRFLQIDRKEFGKIKGVTDREYYTNSFHVPVWYKTNARHKIETEAPYHPLTNAGHITYVELDGDASQNEQAVEDLVLFMYEKNCGYYGVSHAIDFDPVCGYTGFIGDGPCPRCGRTEFEDVPLVPFAT